MLTYQLVVFFFSIIIPAGVAAIVISMAQDHFRRNREEQS
jgi:hypothetical protein